MGEGTRKTEKRKRCLGPYEYEHLHLHKPRPDVIKFFIELNHPVTASCLNETTVLLVMRGHSECQ